MRRERCTNGNGGRVGEQADRACNVDGIIGAGFVSTLML